MVACAACAAPANPHFVNGPLGCAAALCRHTCVARHAPPRWYGRHTMAPFGLTLGQAAKETGLGKSTILRAVKSGRLSATRNDDGSWHIDPSELFRVYAPTQRGTPDTPGTPAAAQDAPPSTPESARPAHPLHDPETLARLVALEAEVRGLRELLTEVRQSRDTEREQHRMFMAALPKPEASSAAETRRGWWPWRRSA
jgi:excisionase family DNA binding protein